MVVASGDTRQEMEELFGPNIIHNLDRIGLSMDEANKIVSGDIAIRRMMYVKVTSKALAKVTPQTVKAYYDEWVHDNIKPTLITYRMLTVRDPDSERAEKTAEALYKKLNAGTNSLEELFVGLEPVREPSLQTNLPIPIKRSPRKTGKFSSAPEKEASAPVQQVSRAGKLTVWRLFLVAKKEEGGIPPFVEVET